MTQPKRPRIGADVSPEYAVLLELAAAELGIKLGRRITVKEAILRGLAKAYPEQLAAQTKKELGE